MPAVIIRMIDALVYITENTTSSQQRNVLIRQAEMIMRGAEEEVPEPNDVADIRVRYDRLLVTANEIDSEVRTATNDVNRQSTTIGEPGPVNRE